MLLAVGHHEMSSAVQCYKHPVDRPDQRLGTGIQRRASKRSYESTLFDRRADWQTRFGTICFEGRLAFVLKTFSARVLLFPRKNKVCLREGLVRSIVLAYLRPG
jgi:hypothetical protein